MSMPFASTSMISPFGSAIQAPAEWSYEPTGKLGATADETWGVCAND
jgi:hypothetical protein